MNIVITMAGLGSRFRKAGYQVPKYQIEVRGKSLFAWSMKSLVAFSKEKFIFIVQKKDAAKEFIANECQCIGISSFTVLEIPNLTRGQAETVLYAKRCWDETGELFIYNIDTYVEPGQLVPDKIRGDGFIPCFQAEGNHWSFVRLDEAGRALEVREKTRISEYCSIGAYYFRSAKLYEELYRELYGTGYLEKGEQYIAPLYNKMIAHGMEVRIQDIPTQFVHVLGTPEEVEKFRE